MRMNQTSRVTLRAGSPGAFGTAEIMSLPVNFSEGLSARPEVLPVTIRRAMSPFAAHLFRRTAGNRSIDCISLV
jgi:hypothetical protein